MLPNDLARRLTVLYPEKDGGYRELHTGRLYPPGSDPIGDNLIILRVVYDNKSTDE